MADLRRRTDLQVDKRLPADYKKIAEDLLQLPDPTEEHRRADDRRLFLVRLKPYIMAAYERGWSVASLVKRFKDEHKKTVGRNLLSDLVKLWTGDATYQTIVRLFPEVVDRPDGQRSSALQTSLARADAEDQMEHCVARLKAGPEEDEGREDRHVPGDGRAIPGRKKQTGGGRTRRKRR